MTLDKEYISVCCAVGIREETLRGLHTLLPVSLRMYRQGVRPVTVPPHGHRLPGHVSSRSNPDTVPMAIGQRGHPHADLGGWGMGMRTFICI